jgi:hypothetical protein
MLLETGASLAAAAQPAQEFRSSVFGSWGFLKRGKFHLCRLLRRGLSEVDDAEHPIRAMSQDPRVYSQRFACHLPGTDQRVRGRLCGLELSVSTSCLFGV